jgi:acyl-CoA thioesterase FadM
METPHVPPSSQLRFRVTLHTRWSDEDNQAVLNNAVYLTLFEETRFRYFSDLGLLEENRFPFVLAQTNVLFMRPGRGGVDVIVEAGTTHMGTSSFTQAYRVIDARTRDVWCEGEARLVAWDPIGRKRGTMTDDFRRKVLAFDGLS